MAGGNRHGLPDLTGGRALVPQQVALVDVRFVPALNLSVITEVGELPLGAPCLRVIDLSTAKAMITPANPRWMRQFAAELVKMADEVDALVGVGSPATRSIKGG